VPVRVTSSDYRALAELRYRIRHFLSESDGAARRVGLEPQQYLLLLMVRGLPQGTKPTVRVLAERLGLKHNSTVELLNRMELRGYVQRDRRMDDRRHVLVSLLPCGQKLLDRVARQRITEVRTGGAKLVNAVIAVLGYRKHGRKDSINIGRAARKRPSKSRN
jgi:DNA-binding MarR family transcriptional regulator